MKRVLLAVLLGGGALILIGSIGFTAWALSASEPMPEALAAITPDRAVAVSTDPWLVFEPQGKNTRCGLIFYPGGRVDPRAYAPPARQIAQNGITAVIVPMPLNLAFFAPNRASDVMTAYPDIDIWVIGGHSLGGTMAAGYTASNPETVDGLVLWASYPTGGSDLSDENLVVTSIYGTRDGLVEFSDIQNSVELLPPDASLVRIEGGNHAQFAWYGDQSGDLQAEIPRREQETQVLTTTLDLFRELDCNP